MKSVHKAWGYYTVIQLMVYANMYTNKSTIYQDITMISSEHYILHPLSCLFHLNINTCVYQLHDDYQWYLQVITTQSTDACYGKVKEEYVYKDIKYKNGFVFMQIKCIKFYIKFTLSGFLLVK